MERLTDREVQMSIEFLVGDEYSQIGEYTGVADKMLMRHNVCGYEYEILLKNFKKGTRCQQCKRNKKL